MGWEVQENSGTYVYKELNNLSQWDQYAARETETLSTSDRMRLKYLDPSLLYERAHGRRGPQTLSLTG
jgi:hypothetical protein